MMPFEPPEAAGLPERRARCVDMRATL